MRFPTLHDIELMRSRGFDSSTVAPLEVRCKRAELVRERIRKAFSGVVLGNGVGLLQGQALDDYADKRSQAKARANDEKLDWNKISPNELNACNSSLSFFDSEGMRFHLPAFMLAELNGDYGFDLSFHLALSVDYERKFSLLNHEQRQVVRDYLILIRDEPDMEINRDHIDRAIEDHWSGDKAEA